jgi:hypothetical protein
VIGAAVPAGAAVAVAALAAESGAGAGAAVAVLSAAFSPPPLHAPSAIALLTTTNPRNRIFLRPPEPYQIAGVNEAETSQCVVSEHCEFIHMGPRTQIAAAVDDSNRISVAPSIPSAH